MTRNKDHQKSMLKAAEIVRRRKEKEKREENEYYERITSGNQWFIFKSVVIFCTLIAVFSTFDTFFDGQTKKITTDDYEINREWKYNWHIVLDVEGYMFTPLLSDWFDKVESSLEITYSPIFRTGKKLSYDIKENETTIRKHVEFRKRSMFTWFPLFPIILLIPLFTLIYKRQKPWFNFARLTSMVFIFPGTLLVMYFTLW